MKPPSTSPTLMDTAAIAALTFIVACVSHEVIGHGVACLAGGGRITLLTSVYFHCDNGGVMADLGGPSANLALGFGAYLFLEWHAWSTNLRLVLVLSLAFNLFWLAGCMLISAAAGTSDFAYLLRILAVDPPWVGRAVLGALGLLVYRFGIYAASKHVAQGTPLAVSYAVAGCVSCGAALFFAGPVAPAVGQAALESFASAIGLLILALGARGFSLSSASVSSASSYRWLTSTAVVTIAFFLLLGRGLVLTGDA